jgi:hypothetical protein
MFELRSNKAPVFLLRHFVICVSRREKAPEDGIFGVRCYGSTQLFGQGPKQFAVLSAEGYFIAPRARAP